MYLKLIMGSTNCTVIKHVMFVDYDVILVYFHPPTLTLRAFSYFILKNACLHRAQWAHKLVLRLIFRTFRCGGHHIDVDWNGCEANSVLLHVLAVANFGENKPFKCMFFLSHS